MTRPPLLEVRDVTVRFGGVTALDGVSLSAEAGVVTGLIGPNGAGKTTLFNVVTGLQSPTAGRVLVDGRDVTGLPVHRRARLGLARTFQRLELFGSLSVRANVQAGAEIPRLWRPGRRDLQQRTDAIIDQVGLRHVADAPAHTLPTGLARLTELARALATRPRLLLLDEPGSGLDPGETVAFGRLLADLATEGVAILLVEHDMELVMRACTTIHVLDFGRHLASGAPADVRADPRVQSAYLGQTENTTGPGGDRTPAVTGARAGTGAPTATGASVVRAEDQP